MSELPHVVIVLARCRQSRHGFGIRFEQTQERRWEADWAFVLNEASARKEGYDRGEVTGDFAFTAAYPGCPHCRATGIFKCGCGKVACWDGEQRTVVCPWCGARGDLAGQIESLGVGGDR
jgi:hypothetical protein